MAAFTVLAHDTLTGTAGSWSSSGDLYPIPTTYDHLYMVVSARSSIAAYYDTAKLTLGTSSAAAVDHSTTTMFVDSSTAESDQTDGDAFISYFYVPGASVVAGAFGSMEIWIPNYSTTSGWKVALGSAVVTNNVSYSGSWDGKWMVSHVAGLKQTLEAINQVGLTLPSANFIAASTFTLYGVTGAS